MSDKGSRFIKGDHSLSIQTIQPQAIVEKNNFFDFDLSNLLSQRLADRLLMWSMSLTFFWFGILKVFNMSPVVGLLQHSFSLFATQPYLGLLGFFEILIAVGLLIPRIRKLTITLTILHLFGTISVVCIAPNILFAPYFPVLTMEGEFILKNFVLISACLILLFRQRDPAPAL